ncbi:hypothetical protein CORC01_01497 [Colletotrichum orchidophilum]|uniref:Glycoside hydrolase 131 catalytic N-terminal domain-containing protein n=1 Tax=Colletotrichum orchidophilum TaxID=1209926 RepID=A0A1G4BP90_9PEZI|nr:uncharacterized protein CORC01_01497 [Colletotrichum orchidophilum]OHF03113.1 hypothetical protein CORC01_01497 [Colletotrichum orchidophilum]
MILPHAAVRSAPSAFAGCAPPVYRFALTTNGQSIFSPRGYSPQLGFRRAGLLLGIGSDDSNEDVMTTHWNSMLDSTRKLNLTHESLITSDKPSSTDWKLLDRNNTVIFMTALKFNI